MLISDGDIWCYARVLDSRLSLAVVLDDSDAARSLEAHFIKNFFSQLIWYKPRTVRCNLRVLLVDFILRVENATDDSLMDFAQLFSAEFLFTSVGELRNSSSA